MSPKIFPGLKKYSGNAGQFCKKRRKVLLVLHGALHVCSILLYMSFHTFVLVNSSIVTVRAYLCLAPCGSRDYALA